MRPRAFNVYIYMLLAAQYFLRRVFLVDRTYFINNLPHILHIYRYARAKAQKTCFSDGKTPKNHKYAGPYFFQTVATSIKNKGQKV